MTEPTAAPHGASGRGADTMSAEPEPLPVIDLLGELEASLLRPLVERLEQRVHDQTHARIHAELEVERLSEENAKLRADHEAALFTVECLMGDLYKALTHVPMSEAEILTEFGMVLDHEMGMARSAALGEGEANG